MLSTLIVPGLNGSGPTHWQSWFETLLPEARRVEQEDWSTAELARWRDRVLARIDGSVGRVVLVAHSFGCLASVAAAAEQPDRIAGALLVAPADPRKFGVGHLLPSGHLGFPSIVVASTDDPWVSLATARHWAGRWASRFINVGARGHINVDSGFGPWPEGFELYESLVATILRPAGVAAGRRPASPNRYRTQDFKTGLPGIRQRFAPL
ncbi:RBBP9/YdeN family alpha/beta hydrolase [Pseudothauera rhizosphaerae]|uniref:Alpha/beta hydrolase n=1 Tax=Pseudothauera rhizosphaerae TaxID=2565932 RepID=A0A4S4AYF8_9RHOO|nr:alpha/beta hydrolase [Pseudothauera rhizosphaerae]THF65157.1 alpha/beta hydrolase [Pseudothauera rhizosphaerae]